MCVLCELGVHVCVCALILLIYIPAPPLSALPLPSSEELVRFHKTFHSSLSALKDVQDEEELLWRFLHILESNLPYITVYGPFLASQQPIRKKVGGAYEQHM